MIETLLARRLTTTTRVSSEVSAMLVERLGAAATFFGAAAVRAARTITTAIRSPVPLGAHKTERRDFRICEFFMTRPPGTAHLFLDRRAAQPRVDGARMPKRRPESLKMRLLYP